jgi:hypothetical protein
MIASMRHQSIFMSIRNLLFFMVLLVQATLSAKDIDQEIKKASSGDFVIYAYKQQSTLLRIAGNNGKELVVEEISSPKPEIRKWQEWLNEGAPGHSSWTISRISLDNGTIKSVYNVDERAYITTPITFPFLPTLLTTPLTLIAASEKKRIGAEPLPGEMDFRPLWLPKIIFEGKELKTAVEAFRLVWPRDESELSGKTLELYFPVSEAIIYLPYWIEMNAGLNKIKICVIDAGKGLSSPRLSLYDL